VGRCRATNTRWLVSMLIMSEEAKSDLPQVAEIGWRCMKASTALHARCEAALVARLLHGLADRAADSCGIMRAVSAAESAVPCAKIPAYTISSSLLDRGSRPSMIQLKRTSASTAKMSSGSWASPRRRSRAARSFVILGSSATGSRGVRAAPPRPCPEQPIAVGDGQVLPPIWLKLSAVQHAREGWGFADWSSGARNDVYTYRLER
jgi:hypothetical protein